MNPLTVHTLGIPEVRYQEKRLKFRSRKALALLVYLAVEPGAHSREKLINLFWSQSDPQNGRVSLRGALSQLRKALRVTGEPIVETTSDLVRLDRERPFHLDLDHIATALLPKATADDWQTVVAAKRGEFLEGFTLSDAPGFDEWATVQRQIWHSQIERIYQRLVTYHLDRSEGTEAARTAARWVTHSSLNEMAYHCLMEAQALMGNRMAALQTYNQCQRTLKDDLDIVPGLEISTLAEHIRKDEMRKVRDDTASSFKIQPSFFPLVGRATEHSQLVAAFRAAAQGTTRVTAVIGNAGVGKTRLVEAFLNWSRLDNPAVDSLRGRAYEMGGHLPYQPLVAAIRVRMEQENAPEDLLDDIWLAELSQLLPELRGRYPDLPPPITGEADFVRARLFEAVAQLGSALAARQSLILFIDDLQWGESSTLDILHYLVQSWAETHTPLLLVLTLRQEALLATPALQEWLMRVERDVPLTRIELAELTAVDVQQLVHQLASADPITLQSTQNNAVQQFSDWLYQKTGGQPFALHEMIQMLTEQGILQPTESDDLSNINITAAWQHLQSQKQVTIPPNVRQVLLARQSRLSEEASALLWAGAVLGRNCSFERLCQVSGVAELTGLSALEELLNGRLMLELSSAQRPYTFAHDNIREVAYTEAGEARRRLFHRRALAALEKDKVSPAELAFHALAARLDKPACRYSLAAGDAAKQAYAYSEALTHYNHARELTQQSTTSAKAVQTVDSQLLCQLYANRGRVLELAFLYDEVVANYAEMFDLANRLDDPALRLAALVAHGAFLLLGTPHIDLTRSKQMIGQALLLARELDDRPIEATVLWHMSRLANHEDNSETAVQYGEASLAIARELDLEEQLAFTLHDLQSTSTLRGDFRGTQDRLTELRSRWQALGNLPMLGEILWQLANHYFLAGEFDQALTVGKESYQLLHDINNLWNLAPTCQPMAWALREKGVFDQAITYMKEIIEVDHDGKFGWGRTMGSFILAQIYQDVGMTADALNISCQGSEYLQAMPMPSFMRGWIEIVVSTRRQIWRAAFSDTQEAFRSFEFEPADMLHYLKNIGGMKTTLPCELALAAAAYQQAVSLADKIIAVIEPVGMHRGLPDLFYFKGQALLKQGDVTAAYESLQRARTIAKAQRARRIRWQILAVLAELENSRGHEVEAEKLQNQAQEIVAYIADQISSDDMQASFLNRPDVKEIGLKS